MPKPRLMTARLFLDVTYNDRVTDDESVASALDTLLETAMSTPDILDEYDNPTVDAFYILPRAEDVAARIVDALLKNKGTDAKELIAGILEERCLLRRPGKK